MRRARRTVWFFARANGLDAMLTLTFAVEVDRAGALVAWRALLRRHRRRVGPFPWLCVPEDQGRWHVHVLVPSAVAEELAAAWALGHVHVAQLSRDSRLRSDADLRKLCGYVSKGFVLEPPPPGTRRYYLARGFSDGLKPERFEAESEGEALGLAAALGFVVPGDRDQRGHGTELLRPPRVLPWLHPPFRCRRRAA